MADVKHELLLQCLLNDNNDLGSVEARRSVLTMSLDIIREIKAIVKNGYLDDHEAMEQIVTILTSRGIDCGFRKKNPNTLTIN